MVDDGYLITVSGPPAAGTSSLCERLAERIGAKVVSGGDMFRKVAKDRGLEPHELSEVAETDDSIDKEIDEKLKNRIDQHVDGNESQNLIVDSRLAGWHADGRADLSIWLQAPIEVRTSRLDDRDESVDELRQREASDAQRYMEYYGIDIDDMSVYDLVIDTDTFSQKGTVEIAMTALN